MKSLPPRLRKFAPLLPGLLLLPVLVVPLGLGCTRGPRVEEERTPAQVMSFRSADWLEREGRIRQEQPDKVIATMGVKAGDMVADVGCGTGFFTRRLARAVGPSGAVYAVDIQPEMLDRLRQSTEAEGLTNVLPVLGTDRDPALPMGKIDWIIIADVYHEMQEPKAMLKALKASLAPEGRIALLEYRALGKSASHIHHDHRMTVKQVLSEWEPAGFELDHLHEFLPSQHFFIFKVGS